MLSAGASAIEVNESESLRTFDAPGRGERSFCSTCGSTLFYRLHKQGTDRTQIMLAEGALSDVGSDLMNHEVFEDRRPTGFVFSGELPGMNLNEYLAMLAGI